MSTPTWDQGSWQPAQQPSYAYGQPPAAPPEPPRRSGPSKAVIGLVATLVVVVVGAVVTIALLTSGDDESTGPAPLAQSSENAEDLSPTDRDAAFYVFVQRHPYSQNGTSREDWIGLAGSMCGAFDRGAAQDDVTTILVQEMSDMTISEAEDFIAEAVKYYCPEHAGRLN